MGKYTEEEITAARNLAVRLDLKGAEKFIGIPMDEALRICNGIGAEWMPSVFRDLLDKMHPNIKIAAMIHDVEYQYGDGSDEDFRRANRNLFENGWTIVKNVYGWYNPMRYIAYREAQRLADICDKYGRKAYDAARLAHMMEC